MTLTDLDGKKNTFSELEGPKMLFFLSPECPLCENYALNINQIYNDSLYNEFHMFGIFPGEYYSESKIKAYKIKYEIEMPFLLDPNYQLTHSLEAKITPEVFLFDEHDELFYSGAIDNWMVSLGRKRTKISDHYLLNAITALKNGETISTNKTKAIGCFIE